MNIPNPKMVIAPHPIKLARYSARLDWPNESCGLLLRRRNEAWPHKQQTFYQAHSNLATDPRRHFRISPVVMRKALDSGELLAVVHSHPDGFGPSEADRRAQKAMGVPWIVLPVIPDSRGHRHRVKDPILVDADNPDMTVLIRMEETIDCMTLGEGRREDARIKAALEKAYAQNG